MYHRTLQLLENISASLVVIPNTKKTSRHIQVLYITRKFYIISVFDSIVHYFAECSFTSFKTITGKYCVKYRIKKSTVSNTYEHEELMWGIYTIFKNHEVSIGEMV